MSIQEYPLNGVTYKIGTVGLEPIKPDGFIAVGDVRKILSCSYKTTKSVRRE